MSYFHLGYSFYFSGALNTVIYAMQSLHFAHRDSTGQASGQRLGLVGSFAVFFQEEPEVLLYNLPPTTIDFEELEAY